MTTEGIPQIDYLCRNDDRQPDFIELVKLNWRKNRCLIDEDNIKIKKLNDKYIQERREKVRAEISEIKKKAQSQMTYKDIQKLHKFQKFIENENNFTKENLI